MTVDQAGGAAAAPAIESGRYGRLTEKRGRDVTRFAGVLALIVLVGLILRVGYVLVHGDSLAHLGIDAGYYHNGANFLADGDGFTSPVAFYTHRTQGALHPPAYQVVLSATSVLGMRSVRAHQLWSCVLGAGAIAIVGFAAREIGGHRCGLIAAGIAALYPSFWFNDALLMSESLVVGLTALVVFLAYRFRRSPTIALGAWLGVACGLSVLTRAEMVLFVPLLVVPLALLAGSRSWRRRAELLTVSLVAVILVLTPWVAYNSTRFEKQVVISSGLGQTLYAANCGDSYFRSDVGYWSLPCLFRPPPRPFKGDESEHDATYRSFALDYARDHAGRIPFVVLARLGRTWGFYAPFQQLRFDERDNRREIPLSLVALGCFYVLAAASVAGVVMLRRRDVPVFPVLAPIFAVTIAAALTYGQTRLRTSAEVSLALLAAVAADELVARRRSRAPNGVQERAT